MSRNLSFKNVSAKNSNESPAYDFSHRPSKARLRKFWRCRMSCCFSCVPSSFTFAKLFSELIQSGSLVRLPHSLNEVRCVGIADSCILSRKSSESERSSRLCNRSSSPIDLHSSSPSFSVRPVTLAPNLRKFIKFVSFVSLLDTPFPLPTLTTPSTCKIFSFSIPLGALTLNWSALKTLQHPLLECGRYGCSSLTPPSSHATF